MSVPPKLNDFVWQWIQAHLPWAGHIERSDVDRWLDAVLAQEAERLKFHLRRLGGIGGSECAVPWLERQGRRDPFATCRELVEAKLLRRPPQPETAHILRGKQLEPLTIRLFLDSHQMVPDREAMAIIARHRGTKAHPWRRANPDLVARDPEGRRWLIDIKCPQQSSDDDTEVMPRYMAQLHHMYDIAKAESVTIDRLAVVELDFAAADYFARLAATCPQAYQRCIKALLDASRQNKAPDLAVRIHPVAYQETTSREIAEACDWLWHQYLLKGQVPDFPKSPELEIDSQHAKEIRNLLDLYAACKAIGRQAEALANKTVAQIRSLTPQSAGKLMADAASMTMQPEYDGDRLAAWLRGQGQDPEKFRRYKWDTDKLVGALRQALGDQFDPTCFTKGKPDWNVPQMVKALEPDVAAGLASGYRPTCRMKPETSLPDSFTRDVGEILEKSAVYLSQRLIDGRYASSSEPRASKKRKTSSMRLK